VIKYRNSRSDNEIQNGYPLLNSVRSITEEHEVVPPSDFKLTPESKNFNISMTTASYYVSKKHDEKFGSPQMSQYHDTLCKP
jgi:hypothetical protein